MASGSAENPVLPVFPFSVITEAFVKKTPEGDFEVMAHAPTQYRGLSKRELFAALAMAGRLAAGQEDVSAKALADADAQLDALAERRAD